MLEVLEVLVVLVETEAQEVVIEIVVENQEMEVRVAVGKKVALVVVELMQQQGSIMLCMSVQVQQILHLQIFPQPLQLTAVLLVVQYPTPPML